MLNAETFVPRSLKNLDFLTCYSLAFSTYQITQMEHSHDLELIKEDSTFGLEEAISKIQLVTLEKYAKLTSLSYWTFYCPDTKR